PLATSATSPGTAPSATYRSSVAPRSANDSVLPVADPPSGIAAIATVPATPALKARRDIVTPPGLVRPARPALARLPPQLPATVMARPPLVDLSVGISSEELISTQMRPVKRGADIGGPNRRRLVHAADVARDCRSGTVHGKAGGR